MRTSYGVRAGALALGLLVSGCHVRRPGEVRPAPIPACDAQRIAYLESRFEQATPAEREFLNYCRTAQSTAAVQASQEHLDYMADLQFLGIALGLVSSVLTFISVAAL